MFIVKLRIDKIKLQLMTFQNIINKQFYPITVAVSVTTILINILDLAVLWITLGVI